MPKRGPKRGPKRSIDAEGARKPLEWLLERTWKPPEPKKSSPGRLLADLKEPRAEFWAAIPLGPEEPASPLPVLLLAK